jgi:hypothetical protein
MYFLRSPEKLVVEGKVVDAAEPGSGGDGRCLRRKGVVDGHPAAVETRPATFGDGLLQQHLQTTTCVAARGLVQVVTPR